MNQIGSECIALQPSLAISERDAPSIFPIIELSRDKQVQHFDLLIVGAGLSGIGAAYYLKVRCPTKSFAILEARQTLGGTWDLFRYPGIRSDSDMYTLGYSFRPWLINKSFADGPTILKYLRDTATEHGIDRTIRFGHRVQSASWSSTDALWTVEAESGPEGTVVRCTSGSFAVGSGILMLRLHGFDEAIGACMPQSPRADGFDRHRIVAAAAGVCRSTQTAWAAHSSVAPSAQTSIRSPRGCADAARRAPGA